MMEELAKITQGSDFLKTYTMLRPKTAIVLGSGMNDIAEKLGLIETIDYKDIPYFPVSTAQGHKGRLLLGKDVVCMQGRIHFYEGYTMEEVIRPIRMLHQFGVRKVIFTNAAGAVNTQYNPGDIMVLTDHINFMGKNPLVGKNLDQLGPRFPDMSQTYDKVMSLGIEKACEETGLKCHTGVYMAFCGPSYETPAEVRMARALGADAVGMSTVPEVIAARHMGMKIAAFSFLTNPAAGVTKEALSHEEVLMESAKGQKLLSEMISIAVRYISQE